jgi:hypothetical protein
MCNTSALRTHYSWMFRKIIAICCENYTRPLLTRKMLRDYKCHSRLPLFCQGLRNAVLAIHLSCYCFIIQNDCSNFLWFCRRVWKKISQSLKVNRENQQDATNSMFIMKLSISTCFGHHYAHHQENKAVSFCMRCSAWACRLWLAVVLWSCFVTQLHKTTANYSLHTQAEHRMQ